VKSALAVCSAASGLWRSLRALPALAKDRNTARSPSTAMLTAVLTGVPSRRYVVSATVRCVTKGASVIDIRSLQWVGSPPETGRPPSL
jgi:hypothetical protein